MSMAAPAALALRDEARRKQVHGAPHGMTQHRTEHSSCCPPGETFRASARLAVGRPGERRPSGGGGRVRSRRRNGDRRRPYAPLVKHVGSEQIRPISITSSSRTMAFHRVKHLMLANIHCEAGRAVAEDWHAADEGEFGMNARNAAKAVVQHQGVASTSRLDGAALTGNHAAAMRGQNTSVQPAISRISSGMRRQQFFDSTQRNALRRTLSPYCVIFLSFNDVGII